MKKHFLLLTLIIIFITFLSVIQVVVSNSYSTSGIFLDNLEEEVKVYKEENAKIKENLLLASSYTEIASKASSLGFLDNKSEIYLNSPLPIAVKP